MEIESNANGSLRCPTCRAQQAWSDECRRCKCDLRLLRAAEAAAVEHRRQCLIAVREERWPQAFHHARQLDLLKPSSESRRLVACCALMNQDWPLALSQAHAASG